ncbi:hypothetical protein QBC46DRAFT_14713 [Diplogelasinospora grovesii]|uniref:Histone-lysine N-methyltransferase n=1 Tax=Diplogelasinospora grovesii TaxID=303347 RepID=A0AAN6S8I7_9PEZI|nr:hypothetical protein QBC46DRAFT_14713 [Diplogelasinospora grovesii]
MADMGLEVSCKLGEIALTSAASTPPASSTRDPDFVRPDVKRTRSTPPATMTPDSNSIMSDSGTQPSTPPTSVSPDSASVACDELESSNSSDSIEPAPPAQPSIVVARDVVKVEHESPPPTRPQRARSRAPVYNLAKLSGTDAHGRRRAKGDVVRDTMRRRTIAGSTPLSTPAKTRDDTLDQPPTGTPSRAGRAGSATLDASGKANCLAASPAPDAAQELGARSCNRSSQGATTAIQMRRATRRSGLALETPPATDSSVLGKRRRESDYGATSRMSRELRRLQDTDEYAHIDRQPVKYTVWSKGKYVEITEDQVQSSPAGLPPRKRARLEESGSTGVVGRESGEREEEEAEAEAGAEAQAEAEDHEAAGPATKKRRVKQWLAKGLYAGQEAADDVAWGLTQKEKRKLATMPELAPRAERNKTMPMPLCNGMRLLMEGRDFRLPFDICNPLPPGQPKPAPYKTLTKNRFIGEAKEYWRRRRYRDDMGSKCVCEPEDGCGEACQNRIMLYECDDTNCEIGPERCTNRAFQELQGRIKDGGAYRVGVEVFKTADRGFGIRSNRSFDPGQIIMEYTGEIITAEECDRRMSEKYKDNECYYLMSYDQNMIIDATTGSIARFVNHSCEPNCRMIKWIVSGQPRMALFAGDRQITTGEELTYDYKFDPFSAKNVQKCLCGSEKCRGVLGPKSKEATVTAAATAATATAATAATATTAAAAAAATSKPRPSYNKAQSQEHDRPENIQAAEKLRLSDSLRAARVAARAGSTARAASPEAKDSFRRSPSLTIIARGAELWGPDPDSTIQTPRPRGRPKGSTSKATPVQVTQARSARTRTPSWKLLNGVTATASAVKQTTASAVSTRSPQSAASMPSSRVLFKKRDGRSRRSMGV